MSLWVKKWRGQLHNSERIGRFDTSGAIELGIIRNEITFVVSRSMKKQDIMGLQRSNPFPNSTLNHLPN